MPRVKAIDACKAGGKGHHPEGQVQRPVDPERLTTHSVENKAGNDATDVGLATAPGHVVVVKNVVSVVNTGSKKNRKVINASGLALSLSWSVTSCKKTWAFK